MKKSSKLANQILNVEIKNTTSALLDRLNLVLDSLTDENCEPLKGTDVKMVLELKDIAYELFDLSENTIPEAAEDLEAMIKAGL
jgi:uncharacterized Fe-S cluster-containing radical SAM superfamily enzyme